MTVVPRTGIFRYARHHEAEAYCKLGWMPTNALEDTPHGFYSVLMMWLCECSPVEPPKEIHRR